MDNVAHDRETGKPVFYAINKWHTPASDYREQTIVQTTSRAGGTQPTYRIHKSKLRKGYCYACQGVGGIDYINVDKQVPITHLQQFDGKKWRDWMVDDPPCWWSMQAYARQSYGRVLTTGLGLGLYIHALLDEERKHPGKIRRVTVVERSADVIDLLSVHLMQACQKYGKTAQGLRGWQPHDIQPEGDELPWLEIIRNDFYQFINLDGLQSYDSMLIDLWVTSNYNETREAMFQEVIPLLAQVRFKNHNATVGIHGFPFVSQMKPWPEGFTPYHATERGRLLGL